MPKSKKIKLLLSSFSIIATTGIIATTITSCGKDSSGHNKKTIDRTTISNNINIFDVANIEPIINEALTNKVHTDKTSQVLVAHLTLNNINVKNVLYDYVNQVSTLPISGTVAVEKVLNTFSLSLSYHFKKDYTLDNYTIANLVLEPLKPATIKPTTHKIEIELNNQLYALKALHNLNITVNKITANNFALGTISYTNSLTGNFKNFQNMPFNVQIVATKNSYGEPNGEWSTNNVYSLINGAALGRDLALNDPHSNVLSQFNDNFYFPFWNDKNLKFAPGSSRIRNWDNHPINPNNNNKLISSKLAKNALSVSYFGSVKTTSTTDKVSRDAYKFDFVKSYDLTKDVNKSAPTLTNVKATLTEATNQYLAQTKTSLANISVVYDQGSTWKIIDKTTTKTIATITYTAKVAGAYANQTWKITKIS